MLPFRLCSITPMSIAFISAAIAPRMADSGLIGRHDTKMTPRCDMTGLATFFDADVSSLHWHTSSPRTVVFAEDHRPIITQLHRARPSRVYHFATHAISGRCYRAKRLMLRAPVIISPRRHFMNTPRLRHRRHDATYLIISLPDTPFAARLNII